MTTAIACIIFSFAIQWNTATCTVYTILLKYYVQYNTYIILWGAPYLTCSIDCIILGVEMHRHKLEQTAAAETKHNTAA